VAGGEGGGGGEGREMVRLSRFAGYNYIGFPEHPERGDENLIASRKERSKAARRGRSNSAGERDERGRERRGKT